MRTSCQAGALRRDFPVPLPALPYSEREAEAELPSNFVITVPSKSKITLKTQTRLQAALLAFGGFAVEQQREPFAMRQAGACRVRSMICRKVGPDEVRK